MTFCVSVDFAVSPEAAGAFAVRVRRQATDSLALEPDCHAFEVWTASDRPDMVHLHEVYADASAFARHLASEHFREFDTETQSMVLRKSVTLWDRRK